MRCARSGHPTSTLDAEDSAAPRACDALLLGVLKLDNPAKHCQTGQPCVLLASVMARSNLPTAAGIRPGGPDVLWLQPADLSACNWQIYLADPPCHASAGRLASVLLLLHQGELVYESTSEQVLNDPDYFDKIYNNIITVRQAELAFTLRRLPNFIRRGVSALREAASNVAEGKVSLLHTTHTIPPWKDTRARDLAAERPARPEVGIRCRCRCPWKGHACGKAPGACAARWQAHLFSSRRQEHERLGPGP
jgi:hypothetical protein